MATFARRSRWRCILASSSSLFHPTHIFSRRNLYIIVSFVEFSPSLIHFELFSGVRCEVSHSFLASTHHFRCHKHYNTSEIVSVSFSQLHCSTKSCFYGLQTSCFDLVADRIFRAPTSFSWDERLRLASVRDRPQTLSIRLKHLHGVPSGICRLLLIQRLFGRSDFAAWELP